MFFPETVTAVPLLAGDAGTYQSLAAMRAAVDGDSLSPLVRHAAAAAVFGAPERNFRAENSAILDYVRDRVRYTRDPLDIEYVQTPDTMLRAIRQDGVVSGDCDDSAVLYAALAEAVGYETRFKVIGADGENFSHVVVEVRDNADRWITVDPSQRGRGVGWSPRAGVGREGVEMSTARKRLLGEDTGFDSFAWGADEPSFNLAPLSFADLAPADSFVSVDSASPAAVGVSDANAGGFFSGVGDFFGGLTKTIQQVLPIAERYGAVRPVVGYDAAGNPRYASSVLPVGGFGGATYSTLTQAGPLGLPWIAWLAVGGGALLLMSGGKRR